MRSDQHRSWIRIVFDVLGLCLIVLLALILAFPELQTLARRWLSEAGLDIYLIRYLAGADQDSDRPAPKAQARLGKALAWRELYCFDVSRQFDGIAVLGQFDHDPALELLLAPRGRNCVILDADGVYIQLGLILPASVTWLTPWDYTRDGIDELVPDVNLSRYLYPGKLTPGAQPVSPQPAPSAPVLDLKQQTLYTPVLDLQGQIIAQLYGQPCAMVWPRKKDRPPELVLTDDHDPAGRKLLLYRPGGDKTGEVAIGSTYGCAAQADVDLDGNTELLINDVELGEHSDWQLLKGDLALADLPKLRGEEVWQTADVNGDGRTDYFTMDYITMCHTWLDPATGKKTKLQPPLQAPDILLADRGGFNAVGSFFGAGSRQVAYYYGPGNHATSLLVFSPAGKCLYYEEMGEDCCALLTWGFDGLDHLALCTASRVLIYP